MKMFWNKEGYLSFSVYKKPEHKIKYLNKGTTHIGTNLKAIPTGVYKRLARLTSKTEANSKKTIDELYSDHTEALAKAGLVREKKISTL